MLLSSTAVREVACGDHEIGLNTVDEAP